MAAVNLTHHFLIAMPNMADPYFSRSLTYICEHSDQGALGIVVNRPIDMTLAALFERLELRLAEHGIGRAPVYFGGPVQTDRGFVLHRPGGRWDSTHVVSEQIQVTTSRDILGAIARGEGPQDAFMALGYAGWDAGQLDREMLDNAWLSLPMNERIAFELPYEERWQAAWQMLGVDSSRVSFVAGHA